MPIKKKVVVIDDDPETVEMLCLILRDRQWSVLCASEPFKGLAMAAMRRPDLIILDLIMPRIDGFGVLQKLKEHPQTQQIPVLVLSADHTTASKDKAYWQRSDAYLTKPINVSRLIKTVDRLTAQGSPLSSQKKRALTWQPKTSQT